jgi:hypothetical protein
MKNFSMYNCTLFLLASAFMLIGFATQCGLSFGMSLIFLLGIEE